MVSHIAKMSFATPLPPAYSKSYSSTKSYQPFSSDKSDKKSTTSSKRSRWSRKSKKEEMSDYGRPYNYDEKSLSSSRNTSSATSTRTMSTTDYSSRKSSSAAKSTKTNKSSRSWIKRVFIGDSDSDLDEDPEAKRRERNAMWRNMSMGYEVSTNLHLLQTFHLLITTIRIENSPSHCLCSSGSTYLITRST